MHTKSRFIQCVRVAVPALTWITIFWPVAHARAENPILRHTILDRGTPNFCMPINDHDQTALSHDLAEEFGVRFSEPSAPVYDRLFLAYLYSYFRQMKPVGKPFVIHFSKDKGTRLVWKGTSSSKGTNLFFSDRIVGSGFIKGLKVLAEKCKKEPTQSYIMDYTNAFVRQLNEVLADEARLSVRLLMDFNVKVEQRRYEKHMDRWNQKDLLLLLDMYSKLPSRVADMMGMTVVRMKKGYKLLSNGKPAAALFDRSTDTMKIADAALSDSPSYSGAGSFFHELGRRFKDSIAGFQWDGFCKMSWIQDQTGIWKSKQDAKNFISAAPPENCDEDLAEHFAAYIEQSEKMRATVPDKYNYFNEVIFPEIDYSKKPDPNIVNF